MWLFASLVGLAVAAPLQQAAPHPAAVSPDGALVAPIVRLSSQCELGDDLACLRGAHLVLSAVSWDRAAWYHLRRTELDRQPIERLAVRVGTVGAMCDAGEAASCADLAFYVDLGAGLPRDPERAEMLRARASALAKESCAEGDAFACRLGKRIPDLRP